MILRCETCPVHEIDGICVPRRLNNRSLCGRTDFAAMIADWGATGGPDWLVAKPTSGPPYPSRDQYLAPLRVEGSSAGIARPWEGVAAARKPWEYPSVAAIVHLDQPDMLEVVIASLRAQSSPPYIHVVDTGSSEAVRERLRALELACDDVQIDYLNPRGWEGSSVPVAVAMDLIFAACPKGTEHVYATHVDVFLKSPDFLGYLAARCDAATPVVGYQMSTRSHLGSEMWRTIPSHTATMYHMPTMRRIAASWSMARAAERIGMANDAYRRNPGAIDTETNLGLDLAAAGIGMRWLAADGSDPQRPAPGGLPSWLCLGTEPNEPYETPWLVHERSYTAHVVYSADAAANRKDQVARSMREAQDRIATWTRLPPSRPVPVSVPRRDESGWIPCAHRATQWCCSNRIATCDLGLGEAAGIVEEHECAVCDQRNPARSDPLI